MKSMHSQTEQPRRLEPTQSLSKEDFYIQRIRSLLLASMIIESVPPGQRMNGFNFSKVLAEVKELLSYSLQSGSEN